MVLKGFMRKFRPLEILTEEQVEAIHRGTLNVLRQTGVRFESDWALDFLTKNGCEVDRDKKRVRFPESLVEESLRKCPSSYQLKARNPKNNIVIGGNALHFMNGAGMQTIDLDTYTPRVAAKSEYIDYVKVLDALPNLHFLTCYPYFGFGGVPPVMAIPEGVALKIEYYSKHHITCYSNDCEMFNIKMVQATGGEITGCIATSPPMAIFNEAVLAARRWIEAGFPVDVWGGCVLGGTGPATPVGSVITTNVELISAIVLVQLLDPGHRMLIGQQSYPENMQTGAPAFGAIGGSIFNAIFNQIWRKYRIPMGNSPGYVTGKIIDCQVGYEKAIGGIISALSGANVVSFHGGVHGELTAHPIQAVLDDDVAGMIGRFMEGVEMSDETLAVDLIEEVGPIPGHYLNKAHTRKWWKKEQFVPKVADRLTYPEWMKSGKKSCIDYAKERMEEILATHKPTPLTEDQEDAIKNILEEARNYYKEKGLI